MYTFNITEPVVNTKRNTYKLTIKFMHGDADGYSTGTVYFNKDTLTIPNWEGPDIITLNDALTFLDAYLTPMKRGVHTLNVGYDLREQEEYEAFLQNLFPNRGVLEQFMEANIIVWDTTDLSYTYRASIENYTLTYIDETGTEYNVEVTK